MLRSHAEKTELKHRAYNAGARPNPDKEADIAALLPHWQRGLVHVQVHQVQTLRRSEALGLISTKHLPDYLSQRQWKSVVNQVNAGLRSWAELMVKKLRPEIRALDVTETERTRLYTASKSKKWFTDATLITMVTAHLRSDVPFPNFSKTRTMVMDGPIAQLEDSRTSAFRWWVRISTRPGRPPVRIPLAGSPYMDEADGVIRRVCQVIIDDDDRVRINLVKASAKAEVRDDGVILGLDWGLANLLTTSDGRRYGQALYSWLVERDIEVTTLQGRLQSLGIKPRESKRFRTLTHRIRAYVDNEVGRIVNQIAERDVRELVVESLDFRGKGLSKTLRRIVSRAGRAVLRKRLDAVSEDRGITITEVASPYTSQECTGCYYTNRTNRKSQSTFVCGHCGKKLHADVSGSRTTLRRRSSEIAMPHTSKQATLAYLDQRFHTMWGISADRVRERHTRPNSRAAPDDLVSAGVKLAA